MDFDVIQPLIKKNDSKIVFLIMDGIGGLENDEGKTELEDAFTPHLDQLAEEGICGLQMPVGSGITPGSGPGHLGVFGFDPLKYQVGRGVLAANGINFDLHHGDIAARGNFCTIDEKGRVTDRRAGRISTEKNKELCGLLRDQISIPDVEVFVETVKEHRLLLVLRGENLSGKLHDTDPQQTGVPPLSPKATDEEADHMVEIIEGFLSQVQSILKDEPVANMVLLRGFSQRPNWPKMIDCFGLKSVAIAAYPMYRGLAKLIGMDVFEAGQSIEEEFSTLEEQWDNYDFFYVHVKKTDSHGEDGNFNRKKEVIEEVDRFIPKLRKLNPDVIVVTGDHSTPSKLAFHSWHPVPVILWSEICRKDMVTRFGERECMKGGLGPRFPAVDLMILALANAKRLEKFGA